MSPKQLAVDIRNAYEGRDRDALERALVLLERMAAPVVMRPLDPPLSPEEVEELVRLPMGEIEVVHPRHEPARPQAWAEAAHQRDTYL